MTKSYIKPLLADMSIDMFYAKKKMIAVSIGLKAWSIFLVSKFEVNTVVQTALWWRIADASGSKRKKKPHILQLC